jgi:predicted RNA-binding protein (virulence factor B family)
MIEAGKYHQLPVVKKVEFGYYLDGMGQEILLPKRFAPAGLKPGDKIRVFVYHDSEGRLIATTQEPLGSVGEIVSLQVVSVTHQGAFLDWGLMKDLFLPTSQQRMTPVKGQRVPVLIYLDGETGRVAATEKFGQFLSNEVLTVREKEEVNVFIYRKTELGYEVIINNKHIGLLHFGDVFRELSIGEKISGFIKKIRTDQKIDVMPGQAGYPRIETETLKILRLMEEAGGWLPFHDKSSPQEIHDYFAMSKKAFKMAVGGLYKQKKIRIEPGGIRMVPADKRQED